MCEGVPVSGRDERLLRKLTSFRESSRGSREPGDHFQLPPHRLRGKAAGTAGKLIAFAAKLTACERPCGGRESTPEIIADATCAVAHDPPSIPQ